MSLVDCPEDLLVAARRRPLRGEEESTLTEHLGHCPLCRMSTGLGHALGRLPPIDDQDRELAVRLVTAARLPSIVAGKAARARALPAAHTPAVGTPAMRRVRPLRRRRLVVAAVMLMAGSASAAWWNHLRSGSPPAAPSAPPVRARPAAKVVIAPLDVPPVPSSPAVKQRSPDPGASGRSGASAGQLFAAARRARAAGDLSRAITLYRTLQSRFPGSAETRLSWLSLAQVYLKVNRPEQAIAQYDAYFQSGDQTLLEEATIGKGRALARLGRIDEEQTLWQRFLRDHPESDYRWRAQRRLEELEGSIP